MRVLWTLGWTRGANGREMPDHNPNTNVVMTQTATDDLIHQKTVELCDTIVRQPAFQSIRQRVESFLASEQAQSQYQLVMEKGQALQQKQQAGMPLANDEIQEFEKSRDELVNNPVARDFLDAQQEMRSVQESVSRYVNRTFELGRVPGPDDFSSCGHGCSCH
jgi:cell fate (sporulation/competence/biofilm development) regulator YlbF (YheA/YmcA/DUF963 family)